jgi:hypothetical protein
MMFLSVVVPAADFARGSGRRLHLATRWRDIPTVFA